MPLVIDDEALHSMKITPAEARAFLAAVLYERRGVSLGTAARLAGMDRIAFQKFLGSQHVSVGPTLEELDRDIDTLRQLGHL
jgi:predicted HTH domain antitoxin